MKRLLLFLVILSHMNFTMFMPQVYETDQKDNNGATTDDINSLYEYVDQIVLGHSDSSPEDEDDDTGRYFQLEKIDQYSFIQQSIELKNPFTTIRSRTKFPPFRQPYLTSVFADIQSPPPKV